MARISILGGTGYTGGALVAEALRRGHQVTSVSRHEPEEGLDGATYLIGSALDPDVLARAVEGHDVVLEAVSPRGDMVGKEEELVDQLIELASRTGTRLGVIGSASSLLVEEGGPRLYDVNDIPAEVKPEIDTGMALLETLKNTSAELDWFYVSPPEEFGAWVPAPDTGEYRLSEDVLLRATDGRSTISAADLARAVLDEIEVPKFWRRRFQLVGVPYLVWTAIYELAAGDPWRFPIAVLTGTGSYHLYFLLVSMQLYLVFPLLRRLLRATAGHHGGLFAAAVAYQATAYALLPRVIAQPDALLISYLGFVVVGGIAAWHAEALLAWTASHRRTVFWSTAAVIAAGLGWFALRTLTFSNDPATASAVFQPAIVIESIAVAWTFLALGLTWRGASLHRPLPGAAVGLPLPGPAVGRSFPGRLFRAGADVSFGVYLGHPLLLQGLLAAGLGTLVAGLPQPVITFLTLAVAVPAVYLICAVVARALRRTPLSLALTGHPAAAPVVPVSPGGLRCERQTA